MKYELQTIPVWKAIEAQPECLICYLEHESEQRNVTFFLGNSIMAPEMRVKLNERGFCRRHFHMLAGGSGKLGYSLALRTHMDSVQDRLAGYAEKVRRASGRGKAKAVAALREFLEAQERDCLMCDRIAYNVANYVYTVVKLYADEPEFRTALAAGKGFCLHHLPALYAMGAEVLAGRNGEQLYADLAALEERNLTTDREHLEAFSWQFDYQSEKKTPEEAQDAVPRAVRRLAGFGPR